MEEENVNTVMGILLVITTIICLTYYNTRDIVVPKFTNIKAEQIYACSLFTASITQKDCLKTLTNENN